MKNNYFKCLLIIVIIFALQFTTLAKQVNQTEASTIAKNYLEKFGKSENFSLQTCHEINSENIVLCYLFDILPQGFIVISANTFLPPVIAYSFENNYITTSETNPLLNLLKTDLTSRLNYVSNSGQLVAQKNEIKWKTLLKYDQKLQLDTTFQQWPATGNGWIKTNWTQDSPYDDFCPMDPVTSTRSIAGCPAVAMSQIINFHKTTNNTHFDDNDDYYHNYSGRQYWIDNDYATHGFPSFPQLNLYLDTLNDHYINSIPITSNDVAALTFACGVAATQVYTSSGSGTFGVSQAYQAYQRFSCSTAVLLDTTDTNLFARLSQNMKDALPAHLAIVNASWTSGHNVVVDGYNTDNYYHLNFGWGGSYNDWYLLPQEIPYNLTVIEGVIVDIMKSTTNVINAEKEKNEITVYPNPFVENTNISFSSETESNMELKILDISGNVVKLIPIQKTKEKQSISLSLENCNPGFYFYRLSIGNVIHTGKLVKTE